MRIIFKQKREWGKKEWNINTHPVENTNPRGLKLSTAVENAILSRVRLSTGVETSNPCGLLFSTGGESPNLPGLELSCLLGSIFWGGLLVSEPCHYTDQRGLVIFLRIFTVKFLGKKFGRFFFIFSSFLKRIIRINNTTYYQYASYWYYSDIIFIEEECYEKCYYA